MFAPADFIKEKSIVFVGELVDAMFLLMKKVFIVFRFVFNTY